MNGAVVLVIILFFIILVVSAGYCIKGAISLSAMEGDPNLATAHRYLSIAGGVVIGILALVVFGYIFYYFQLAENPEEYEEAEIQEEIQGAVAPNRTPTSYYVIGFFVIGFVLFTGAFAAGAAYQIQISKPYASGDVDTVSAFQSALIASILSLATFGLLIIYYIYQAYKGAGGSGSGRRNRGHKKNKKKDETKKEKKEEKKEEHAS